MSNLNKPIINESEVKTMDKQKETATTGTGDGMAKNYNDLKTIFLRFCEEKQLTIREAGAVLEQLKENLQCQVCQVATRKEYDNFGDNINYIRSIYDCDGYDGYIRIRDRGVTYE